MSDRRKFLKDLALLGSAAVAAPALMSMKADDKSCAQAAVDSDNFWLVPQY